MKLQDEFRTLAGPSEGLFKAKGSKHYAYAYPISSEADVAPLLASLREQHHKARHHCYAYRLGDDLNTWRANDDGEPNNSAGLPILGQIDSAGLTDVLVVVVRYFGGTKLGMGGLIEAYREACAAAIDNGKVIDCIRMREVEVQTDYAHLSDLMNAVKGGDWQLIDQTMELDVRLTIGYRAAQFEQAYLDLWLVLAKAYPGEEQLEQHPPGYTLAILNKG